MKTGFLIAAISLLTIHPSTAQLKTRTLTKALELKMPKTADDENAGTRGACVVWHPAQKKYYAAFAGNIAYPLATFDANGKRLSKDDQSAQNDVRGLWYNPVEKRIEGNCFGDAGWFYYKLDAKGMIADKEMLFNGLYQPSDQCVGAFAMADTGVLFLDGSAIYFYDATNGEEYEEQLILHFGRTEKQGADADEDEFETPEGYNSTTLVYTGISKAEIGVLNFEKKQVELYDEETGFMKQVLKFPANAVTESTFNFAFTNGIYWLFDMNKRIWTGYK